MKTTYIGTCGIDDNHKIFGKIEDWTGNRTAVFVTNGDSSHSEQEREVLDYYATDPSAVHALLSELPLV